MDSPAVGSLYTWNNKQDIYTRVYSRLDRVLVNQEWLSARGDSFAYFHNEGLFDHSPCIVQDSASSLVGRRSFKYFHMWSQVADFLPCVQQPWGVHWHGTKMFKLVMKLKSLKRPLKDLNANLFADVENNAAHAWKILDNIQSALKQCPFDADLLLQEQEAAKTYRLLQVACDIFLLQKSKATWVNQGDSNSKYFHSIIKGRQSKNKIFRLADINGVVHSDGEHIQNAFLKYYEHLLGSSTATTPVSKAVVRMGTVCRQEHWDILLTPVSKKEIKEAIFSIPNHKAPGPDGFSSSFYKDAWSIVGDEVCDAILDFFNSGKLLQQVNHTFITLLPKCDVPQNVTQFRQIACCNVLYKAISKLLCNRLAQILPDIVSENQGGFIQGRNIIENILICQDIVRLYNRKSVSSRCLIKMDLKKAYDSVNWDFIDQMLIALDFPTKFIQWVMVCVRSTSYSLVLNGLNFGYFKGAKGLRQGDPISPLIFTLTMEYLSRILIHVTTTMNFKYHPLCGALKLNHLMFADDLLMFSKGDISSIMILLRAFATFSVATGLQMNALKSNIYFNGVKPYVKADILQISGFTEGLIPFKYLGIPISAGRLTIKQCYVLIEKVTDRIRSFGAKKLSYSGRLVLVKSVMSSLYNYWANIFVIPKGVLRRIDDLFRNYLWEGSTEYSKAPRVSWEKVCSPKSEGGLGIKNSYAWNIAAIGKLVWWIYTKPDSLWVKWVNHLYIKGSDWASYSPRGDINWSWKAICKVKDKLNSGYSSGNWTAQPGGYTVTCGYNWYREKQAPVQWEAYVWNSWCVPKHNFITWMITREALMLKDRLFALGISQDETCLLCGRFVETHSHLFQQCEYTKKLLDRTSLLLHIRIPVCNHLAWVHSKPWSKVKKIVTNAWIQATYAAIWNQRNRVRIEASLARPDYVVNEIVCLMKMRVIFWRSMAKKSRDELWIKSIV